MIFFVEVMLLIVRNQIEMRQTKLFAEILSSAPITWTEKMLEPLSMFMDIYFSE